jgi:Gene product 88
MSLLTRGNRKLGASIYHFDLPAGPDASCPGASTFCAAVCYARKGHYLFGSVQAKYASNLAAWREHPAQLERNLSAELDRLPAATVIRLHTSGDFISAGYVGMWVQLAATHPNLTFYAYTRSWVVASIRASLDIFRSLPNVTVWASTDDTMSAPPADWPTTRIVASFDLAPGIAHCPEQTGKRASCADCGLCFNRNLRPTARLAFKLH